jgi:hypothetical protein
MEATLLLPQELGRSIFSPPSKGVCNECFLSHSSSLQPRLSAWTENASQQFLYPEQIFFQFSSEPESCTCSPSSENGHQTHSHCILPSAHEFPFFSFLPQQDFVGPNPHFVVRSGSFQMGTLPISSLTLEEDFPTTSLTGNLFFWVRGLFWV